MKTFYLKFCCEELLLLTLRMENGNPLNYLYPLVSFFNGEKYDFKVLI